MNRNLFPDSIKGNRSQKNYSLVYKRDDGICQYCGDQATTIDHIIPWNFKNDNSPENMVASCKICNCIAGDKLFDNFNEKKIYILNRRAQKELGIKDPLNWPDIKFKTDSKFPTAELPVIFTRLCKLCKTKFKTNSQEEKEFCSAGCEQEYKRRKKKKSITPDKGPFKYWRKCKLLSCGKEFGTNRKWQEFCPGSNHQQEWQKLLRRKHEEVIVEMATLKERVNRIENKLGIK